MKGRTPKPEVPAALGERTRVLRAYLKEMGPPDLNLLVGPDAFANIVDELREAALWRDWPPKCTEHRRLAWLVMLDAIKDRLLEARSYHAETVAALETLLRKAFVPAEVQESAQLGRKTREKNRESGRTSARARERRAGREGWKKKAHTIHAALLRREPDLAPKERAEQCTLALRGVVAYRTVLDEITTPRSRARFPEAYGRRPGWSGKL